MFNIKRPENAELLMIKLLSEFIINKQTPHIVLPITTFNTSIKPFISLPKDNIVNNKKCRSLANQQCWQVFSEFTGAFSNVNTCHSCFKINFILRLLYLF